MPCSLFLRGPRTKLERQDKHLADSLRTWLIEICRDGLRWHWPLRYPPRYQVGRCLCQQKQKELSCQPRRRRRGRERAEERAARTALSPQRSGSRCAGRASCCCGRTPEKSMQAVRRSGTGIRAALRIDEKGSEKSKINISP